MFGMSEDTLIFLFVKKCKQIQTFSPLFAAAIPLNLPVIYQLSTLTKFIFEVL